MKVLIATFTFPPNKDGVAEAARAMAHGLASRGWYVAVATESADKRTDFDPHPRLHVEQFQIRKDENGYGGPPEEIERFRLYIRGFDPDYIVCQCWDMSATLLAEEVFQELRAKKILVSHGYTLHLWNPNPKFPWGLRSWIRRLPRFLKLPANMRMYDAVTVLSRQKDFGRFFDHTVAGWIGYKSVHVIPNGTDISLFENCSIDFRAQYSLAGKEVILCVANYGDRKNQELALRAFRCLDRPGSVLVFIGSEFNDYSDNLRKLDAELKFRRGKGEVVFLEKIGRATTIAAYVACDLFLLTAKAETQPIVLIEAMAAGKPFVSTDTGCVRQMDGGVVVEAEESAIANALGDLLQDKEKQSRLGEAGRASVLATYDWKKVLDSYEALLVSLNSHAA